MEDEQVAPAKKVRKKREKTLPWGRLITRKGKSRFYWHYYDKDRGCNLARSTGSDDPAVAFRIAERWAARYLAQKHRLVEEDGQSVALAEAAQKYYDSRREELSEEYAYTVSLFIDNFIVPYFGAGTTVSEIKAGAINDFRLWLLRDRKLAASSVNKVLSTVNKILKYSELHEWVKRVPTITRASQAQEEEHGCELNDEQIAALLSGARKISLEALRYVALGLFCGLRHSEAVRVTWEDIDWEADCIRLPKQKNKSKFPAPLGMARKILELTPERERVGVLVAYRPSYSDKAERYAVKDFRRTWQRIKEEAKLDDFNKPDGRRLGFHDLRHTFATRIYRILKDDTKKLTRHRSVKSLAAYIHVQWSELFGAAVEAFEKKKEGEDRR